MFTDERVELLRGFLVTMSPQGIDHSAITHWLAKRLTFALGEAWDVRTHSPYVAGDDSEPEPDISIESAAADLLAGHPANAALLIEVSSSSLAYDRRIKAPIYAQANVPEYWIVDVSGAELSIEVHTDATPQGYRRVEIVRDGDVLRPARLPEIEIAVREIPWKR